MFRENDPWPAHVEDLAPGPWDRLVCESPRFLGDKNILRVDESGEPNSFPERLFLPVFFLARTGILGRPLSPLACHDLGPAQKDVSP